MSTEHEDFVHLTIQAKDGLSAPITEVVRYDQFVRQLFKADTEAMMALHIAVGLVGEAGELEETYYNDREHYVEELGDLEFYMQAARSHYGISREELLGHRFSPAWEGNTKAYRLLVAVAEFSDVVKREYVYRKPRDRKAVVSALGKIEAAIDYAYDLTIPYAPRSEVLQSNADKLCKRYVEFRYTDQAAIARADKSSSPSQEKD
jgi:hypothetical protein